MSPHFPEKKRSLLITSPARAICLSFFAVIAAGTLLLMLPVSSQDGRFTPLLDALFTATSATCVTGLVVFDTATKWSLFGQLVILALIQIGGLGLVTITTFFNLALGKRLGFRSIQRAQEAINVDGAMDINRMIRIVVKASLAAEGIGALLLLTVFVPKYGLHGVFISVFLAISAFCNAGFDILGFESQYISLTNYGSNPVVMLTITALIIVGGLGFVVWNDLLEYRKNRRLMLQSRVVLVITGILIVAGTAMFLLCEWNNPATLGSMPLGDKLWASYFQSVTTRTAGFNTIDIPNLNPITKTLSMVLMFIGAAPGSTGGGIKVTTIAVVAMTVMSVIRGGDDTVVMRHKVPKSTVYRSLTILVLGGLLVIVAGSVMYFTIPENSIETGIDAMFEAVSAFATVGISSGVTAVANVPSKLILILTMFTGRVGPISFVLSLAAKGTGNRNQVMPDGRIMVG
ncbi:potassium transporter Trk [Clostridiaceae bacterium NSJ-31]|uniref:Potassium transporter Trk n=1 Tax=Ligaoa zhengdingensis TaxID=2763658 RepID=A0A926DYF4_9FIRM|nr:TrkH family potassium uptake protein [Ligaoa zhengdingensis]MBC8546401.1 potassium transporter Trk [Ligaoa zhengdingensis]